MRRLQQELGDEGVRLLEGVAFFEDDPIREEKLLRDLETAILEELLYARQTPVHEGRRASYGSIILADPRARDNPQGGLFKNLLRCSETTSSALRELSNGYSTFVVRYPDSPFGVIRLDDSDEEELASISGSYSVIIIQRHPSGTVKVFTWSFLFIYENDHWTRRPYSGEWGRLLEKYVPAPGILGVAEPILKFATHVLSSRHIGATLVWPIGCSPDDLRPQLSRPWRDLPVKLEVTRRKHLEFLSTALSKLDGACVLSEKGRVVGVEAMLQFSEEAARVIKGVGGTRHTSAARFSFDNPNVILFVVSADGPISIFSDGVRVIYVNEEQSLPDQPWRLLDREVEIARDVFRCETCNRELLIEYEDISLLVREDDLDNFGPSLCPVCGAECIEVWGRDITIRVIKPWEDAETFS